MTTTATATATTVRSDAESSFECRHSLLWAAASGECVKTTDCSAAAAVVLAVMKDHCIVDQVDMILLQNGCVAQGLDAAEFTEACEELEAMDVLTFYFDRETGVAYAKSMNEFGRQVRVDAREAVR